MPKKGYYKLLQGTSFYYFLVMVENPPPKDAEDLQGMIFLGALNSKQVADVYRACDVFVSSSQSQGFSLTLQEATASGLPVTSDSSGYDVYGFDRDLVAMKRPTVSHIQSDPGKSGSRRDLRRWRAVYSLHVSDVAFPLVDARWEAGIHLFHLRSKTNGADP